MLLAPDEREAGVRACAVLLFKFSRIWVPVGPPLCGNGWGDATWFHFRDLHRILRPVWGHRVPSSIKRLYLARGWGVALTPSLSFGFQPWGVSTSGNCNGSCLCLASRVLCRVPAAAVLTLHHSVGAHLTRLATGCHFTPVVHRPVGPCAYGAHPGALLAPKLGVSPLAAGAA